MNESLILFLEENGFVNVDSWGFEKVTHSQALNKIEIKGYGLFCDSDGKPEKFYIDVYSIEQSDTERLIVWIQLYNFLNFEKKVKKIINFVDDLIAVSCTFVKGYGRFSDVGYLYPHDKLILSSDEATIDLSRDELVIIKNQ